MFGIIGSVSWATALAKILTDNDQKINWLVRTEAMAEFITKRKHNPNYLNAAVFNPSRLSLSTDVSKIAAASDHIIIATPSAYVTDTLKPLKKNSFDGKKIISPLWGPVMRKKWRLRNYLISLFPALMKKLPLRSPNFSTHHILIQWSMMIYMGYSLLLFLKIYMHWVQALLMDLSMEIIF